MNTPETEALAKDIGRIYAKSKEAIAPTAYFVNEAQAAIDKVCGKLERERDEARLELQNISTHMEEHQCRSDDSLHMDVLHLCQQNDQLRQALSGRTVSCDNCNRMASELDQLRIERNHRGTEARR